MNVAIFPSARDRDAGANLAAFVLKGRTSKAFGDIDFDAAVWRNVALSKEKRITAGKTGAKDIHFLDGSAARGAAEAGPFQEPFAGFAKALIRLREEARPQHIENHRIMLRAARYIYAALEGSGYDPCLLLPRHFDQAARYAVSVETPNTAYGTGKFLAEIVTWLNERGIGRIRIEWRNTIPRPSSDDREGADAAQRRADKMPSAAALEALPQIAQLIDETTGSADLLRMRTVELLVCGGWRINELLTIPADCEVTEGEPGAAGSRYGIRYFAEKGFGHTIKWIPTAMVSVAQRAVADIRRLTEPVRSDATFFHENERGHTLPVLRGDDNDLIGVGELSPALGLISRDATAFCKTNGIPLVARGKVRKGDVIAMLRGTVPTVPASSPIPLHQHMFLVRVNAMHAHRSSIAGTVSVVEWSMISGFITGGTGIRSVFDRFGFTEPDGSPITVNSHAFRHWLNTLAQEGGMTQELIARWSGRRDVNQNSVYDHVSGADLARKVRGMVESGGLLGQIARVREALPPVERDSFLATQLATGHVTDIGICIHDWQLAPCPVHGDCANCGEHIIDKNNDSQRAEAQRKLEDVEAALVIAEVEASDGTIGAPRWVEAHRRTRAGLLEVMAVHRDAAIPDGTFVHLGDRTVVER